MKFRFENRMFSRGTFFKGEFTPSNRPLPFFDFLGVFFFVPIPIVSPGQFLNNGGGGLYVPILGAPFPPFLLLDLYFFPYVEHHFRLSSL